MAAAQMSFQAVCGVGRALEWRPFCCKCYNASVTPPLMSSPCQITPICKMGPRKTRAYVKRPRAKKVLAKHLTPADSESIAGEGGKDSSVEQGPEVGNGALPDDVLEQVSSGDEAPYMVHKEAAKNVPQQTKAVVAPVSQSDDTLPRSNLVTEDESFIKTMEDLMDKVKDAERNILTLNEARMQSMEQLEQIRRDRDALQAQVRVLELQLAEADAKVKAAIQDKARNRFLEQEVEILQQKLAENAEALKAVSQQGADYVKLSQYAKRMQLEVEKLVAVEIEGKELKKENEMLLGKVESLQSNLAKLNQENEKIGEVMLERDSLQSKLVEMEAELSRVESHAAKLKLEKQVTPPSVAGPYSTAEIQALQDKVSKLDAMLSGVEAENEILQQAQAENEVLREQIKLLEQRLVESDAEIRAQLEAYQAEVEAFQASLEELKIEREASPLSGSERVDDMPWEFWSHVLLSIDGWLLERKISVVDGTALREMAWRREAGIRDAFVKNKGKHESDILAGLLELLKTNKRPGMHIIHIAAEMAPVAKVGGLGDVVTGLGKSLQRKGHLVEVVLPKYDCMDYSRINNLRVLNMDLMSHFDGHSYRNKVWVGTIEGLPVYFIEPHHPSRFFWRGTVYGEVDDFKRFTYFSRAALEFVMEAGKRPDIIHCHDWHTAAVAPLYWDVFVPQGLDSARIAFTCHNFEYQGTESPEALASCGLNPQHLHRPDRMQDNFVHSRINLLKGGIVFSNVVTTVSPTYAQEVQSPEGGKGLHVTLMAQSHKFFGILNGIDAESWNPASDLLISHQYSADDISGKAANKVALRSALNLSGAPPDVDRPIVGCITRLVPQKGVHLIRHAIFRTLELGGQFVLLGSSPIDHIQREFEGLANQFSHHPHVRLVLKYDEALSHSIYAGTDIFVIPSVFEPCGLTQMIAMRYGAIPVARKTGGLNDSVFDVDDGIIPLGTRNGFTFAGIHEKDLNSALDRALNYYNQRKAWWLDLVRKAMRMDFSWNSSANQYAELFERAIARARAVS